MKILGIIFIIIFTISSCTNLNEKERIKEIIYLSFSDSSVGVCDLTTPQGVLNAKVPSKVKIPIGKRQRGSIPFRCTSSEGKKVFGVIEREKRGSKMSKVFSTSIFNVNDNEINNMQIFIIPIN